MKHLLSILLIIQQISCLGQFEKPVTLSATANLNFTLNGLATNTAGGGIGIDASLFSKHKLQALVEASSDWFFGDKLLVYDSAFGKEAKRATVYSIKAGPQFFISKNVAVSATYGPAWHVIRDFNYSTDYGFKFSATAFAGSRRRLVAKLFLVHIPTGHQNIQYGGVAVGVRF